jgi:transcriptional regulator with XRE-family HTH domain
MTKTNIGTTIRSMRRTAGLTQRQLAIKLGVAYTGIARWERKDYKGYTVHSLKKIADACGFDIDVIFKPKG